MGETREEGGTPEGKGRSLLACNPGRSLASSCYLASPACPAISASPRQRNRLALAVRACTECPPQPLRSRSPWRAPAPPGSGGARVWQGLCSDPSGRPAPFPCGRGRLPGTAAALVRRRGRGHPTRLVIINPDTWRPHPPTPVTASPPSPGTSGLGLCKGDSEEPSKNKVPS